MPQFSHLLTLMVLLLMAFTTQSEIFKWIDAEGKVHYSDKKPENLPSNQPVEQLVLQDNKITDEPKNNSTAANNKSVTNTTKPNNGVQKKHKITMYSASWCGYCKKASAYFKKNKIKFNNYDIEKNINARKRYEKLGGNGVPLLVAKRKKMQGFSEAKFRSWYESL